MKIKKLKTPRKMHKKALVCCELDVQTLGSAHEMVTVKQLKNNQPEQCSRSVRSVVNVK